MYCAGENLSSFYTFLGTEESGCGHANELPWRTCLVCVCVKGFVGVWSSLASEFGFVFTLSILEN